MTNDNSIWQHHVETLLGKTIKSLPTSLMELEDEEESEEVSEFGLRAPLWKIKYAQLLRSAYPDAIEVEDKLRELRRRALSLALRFPSDEAEESTAEPSDEGEGEPETEKKAKMSESEKIIWSHMQGVSYIPVRVAFLGDTGVGRTNTILKYMRFFPAEEPFPSSIVPNLRPPSDRHGSTIFTKSEKGYGKFDFHLTISEPASDSLQSQVASLRGVDAVIIGFAVDNADSLRSVADKWLPLVRKWLGQHVPVTAVGTFCDHMNDGISVVEIKDTLSAAGLQSFELCIPPYKRCFWSSWVPDGCPMPDGTWK